MRIKAPNGPILEIQYIHRPNDYEHHARVRTPIDGETQPNHDTMCGKWFPLFADHKEELEPRDTYCPKCEWVIHALMIRSGAAKL